MPGSIATELAVSMGVILMFGVSSLVGLIPDIPLLRANDRRSRWGVFDLCDGGALVLVLSIVSAICEGIHDRIGLSLVSMAWWVVLVPRLNAAGVRPRNRFILQILLIVVGHIAPMLALGALAAWILGGMGSGLCWFLFWLLAYVVLSFGMHFGVSRHRAG